MFKNLLNDDWMFMPMLEGEGAGGAGDGEEGAGEAGKGDGDGAGKGDEDAGAGTGADDGKMYTVKELKAMMAREKRQGRTSALKKLFGTDDEDEASKRLATLTALEEAQKTDAQKKEDALLIETKAKDEALAKATKAELKVTLMAQGASIESLDDLLVLLGAKAKDGDEVKDVVAELKTKYPTMFGDGEFTGTGTAGNPARKKTPGKTSGIGSRLAGAATEAAKASDKNPYFNN